MTDTAGEQWPPYPEVYDKIRRLSAWWSSDDQALTRAFAIKTGTTRRKAGPVRRFFRRFWENDAEDTYQTTPKIHVPVAADVSRYSARALFGRDLTITVPDTTPQPVENRLTWLWQALGMRAILLEAAQVQSAMSGVYLRVVPDTSVAQDRPIVSVVDPLQALPHFSWNGEMYAVEFWRRLPSQPGHPVYRHFEIHTYGRVTHELWQGTHDRKGRMVPLADHSATRNLDVDDDNGYETGCPDALTAVYIPNIRPVKGTWRNHPLARFFGASDYEDAEGGYESVDEAWTAVMEELRAGKTRHFVAESLLDSGEPGEGGSFNEDQAYFVKLNTANANDNTITSFQPTLRTAELLAVYRQALHDAYSMSGWAPASFGLADEVAVTATAIKAREKKSIDTRDAKIGEWAAALPRFVYAVMCVDALYFRAQGAAGAIEPTFTWPEAVPATPEEVGLAVQLARTVDAMSIDEAVRRLNPGKPDDWCAAEIAAIKAGNGMTVEPLDDIPA